MGYSRLHAAAGNRTVELCGFGVIDKLHHGPWLNAAIKEQRNAQFATSMQGHSPPLCEASSSLPTGAEALLASLCMHCGTGSSEPQTYVLNILIDVVILLVSK